MLKLLLPFIVFLISFDISSQNYDTVIVKPAYKSFFNRSLRVPAVVTYKLFKGGGNCSRKSYRFSNDISSIHTARDIDYKYSGFDKGHLANAEDFAFDCSLMKSTFYYYNCVPQTKKMNRGPWKSFESKLRNISQSDSLLIININIFNNRLLNNYVAIPDYCIKIAYSLSSHQNLLAVIVQNSLNPFALELPLKELEKKYNLNINQFLYW